MLPGGKANKRAQQKHTVPQRWPSGVWQQRNAEPFTNSNELTFTGHPRKWRRGLCDTKVATIFFSQSSFARVLAATKDLNICSFAIQCTSEAT